MLAILEDLKVPIHRSNRLEEIRDDKVICRDLVTGKPAEYPCDTVLLALGMVPLTDVAESLRRCTAETEVFIVGDALAVGNIHSATNGGFQAGINI
jgi:heterodisulfide reductase subunit A-like polyferredoxin